MVSRINAVWLWFTFTGWISAHLKILIRNFRSHLINLLPIGLKYSYRLYSHHVHLIGRLYYLEKHAKCPLESLQKRECLISSTNKPESNVRPLFSGSLIIKPFDPESSNNNRFLCLNTETGEIQNVCLYKKSEHREHSGQRYALLH